MNGRKVLGAVILSGVALIALSSMTGGAAKAGISDTVHGILVVLAITGALIAVALITALVMLVRSWGKVERTEVHHYTLAPSDPRSLERTFQGDLTEFERGRLAAIEEMMREQEGMS